MTKEDIRLIKIVIAWKFDDTYRKHNLLLAMKKEVDEVIAIEKNLRYYEHKRKEWVSEGVDMDELEREIKYEGRRNVEHG